MKVQLTGKGVKLVIAAFVGITIYCLLKLQNETGSNSKKDVSSVDKPTADESKYYLNTNIQCEQ